MLENIHRVGIVVDDSFEKEKLRVLSKEMHVWLLETSTNQINAKGIVESEQFNEEDLLADGITTFSPLNSDLPPASELDAILDEVDEHHNEYSHTPGWSEAHVYGVKLDDNLERLFKEFGFSDFKTLDDQGFVAKK